jgi:hypothetical protein
MYIFHTSLDGKHPPRECLPVDENFQTPPDFMVKCQVFDIVGVILRLVGQPHVVDQRELKA